MGINNDNLPFVFGTNPLARAINAIVTQLRRLTVRQTPTIKVSNTPHGTDLRITRKKNRPYLFGKFSVGTKYQQQLDPETGEEITITLSTLDLMFEESILSGENGLLQSSTEWSAVRVYAGDNIISDEPNFVFAFDDPSQWQPLLMGDKRFLKRQFIGAPINEDFPENEWQRFVGGTDIDCAPKIISAADVPPSYTTIAYSDAGVPHLLVPWKMGFLGPNVVLPNPETPENIPQLTMAYPLGGAKHILCVKIRMRWIAERRKFENAPPTITYYPVEPWCEYYKCLEEFVPEFNENGEQVNEPDCEPPPFSVGLVGTVQSEEQLEDRFYGILKRAELISDDVAIAMNGSQTRISGVDFGLKLSDDDNFRWFFETELVSEWVEQQYRVDADSIIQDNVPLVPLEEGEIEDPSQPREFVQERTILLPILTCFRVSQDPLVYNVHAFGDITSTESQFGFDPNLLSGEIVGPEVPASLVPPSWYFFEQYIRPLTFKPNCEFDPDATEIGEPFPETHGNYSVLPDWERGYLIGQRFGNGAQDPPSYFGEIETYPSTYCKRNATDNKLTGARDTDFDFITTGQVTEREEEATWRMWDEDRELTKNAPPQTAFWVPFALGSPFKQIAMRGQYDIDDKRPEPPECT